MFVYAGNGLFFRSMSCTAIVQQRGSAVCVPWTELSVVGLKQNGESILSCFEVCSYVFLSYIYLDGEFASFRYLTITSETIVGLLLSGQCAMLMTGFIIESKV